MNLDQNNTSKLITLLADLNNRSDAEPFRYPVDYEALGLDDYPLVIKKPIDISTITENLQSGMYETVEECLDDIQLIWDNCKLYNMENSKIHKIAIKMETLSRKLVQLGFGEVIYGKNNPSSLALEGRSLPGCNDIG